MTSLSRDARFFVEGVTKVLRDETHATAMFPKVSAALHKITAAARAQTTANVESAVALTSKEKAEVSRLLSRLLLHQIRLDSRVNRNLIGGIKIQVGDWVVDTSLRYQIDTMKEQILV